MKLRNKKTGEIRNVVDIDMYTDSVYLKVSDGEFDNETIEYRSLAELNEEWEDAPEEPKTFFTIYYDGTISEFRDGDDEQIRDMKAIGNYFETREEAEKAVEKLKAWKRLKDKKFKFRKWRTADIGGDKYYFAIQAEADDADKADLDLLFSGGEE